VPPKGIGGWLWLVVAGLLISPIRIAGDLLTIHWPLFRDGAWPVLTTPGAEAYHPLWAPLITFEIAGNTGSILLALTTLWFLLRRSRRAPILAITWLIWTTAIVTIDFFAADLIPAVAAKPDPAGMRELVRSLISTAIWVPYFLVSQRVRATFVE
jgi:hypothetical protein